ncbi:MAG: acyl-CoA dehydrogenase [Porticoccaceae bacterium]
MDKKHFLFSDEQMEIAGHFARLIASQVPMQEVRRVFEGEKPYSVETWQQMAEQGWLALADADGGAGLGLTDLCLLGLHIGKALAPLPFLGHVAFATQALVRFGSTANKQAYLEKFTRGDALATLAFREAGQDDWRQAPSATVRGGLLTGTKVAVAHGAQADVAIVAARQLDGANPQGISLFLVELAQAGVTRTEAETIDPASRYATLVFDGAKAVPLHDGAIAQQDYEQLIYSGVVVDAFMQLGSAQAAFAAARQYALDRYAFGRPIGSFQAIKHKLGRMYESLCIAEANCHFGAAAMAYKPSLLAVAAASAHLAAVDAFNHCARDNNKIHGGISATWEHDCHLYYRRAKLAAVALGNTTTWNAIAAQALFEQQQNMAIDLADFGGEDANQALREEIKAWIAEHRPSEESLEGLSHEQKFARILAWQKAKAAAGWACPQWPEQYGGKGWTPEKVAIWHQEEGEELRDLVYPLSIIDIAGPTIMAWGSEEQKNRYLPKMRTGEEFWCMLFSEPHGGSDVAALRTRAVKDGDEWIVNGQKVWTSNAQHADFGLLVVRTDPNVAKHRGLTYFLIDMHSPGVDVRPLKQITGNTEFCEVFFDNVRIPDSARMGDVGGAWKIIMSSLANEKVALHSFQIHLQRFMEAVAETSANGVPARENAYVQDKLALFARRFWAIRFIELQSMHNLMTKREPGQEEAINKLIVAATNKELASMALDLYNERCFAGAGAGSENLRFFEYVYLHFVGVSMGGGTDEIILNLIGEQFLGMPQEPRVDKDVPFNQLPVGR